MGILDMFKSKVPNITTAEVKAMNRNEILIVDVREPYEYKNGHIPGALNLPLDGIMNDKYLSRLDKNKTIILYCLSGARARNAGNHLVDKGYSKVYNLGAFRNWR